MTTIPTLSVQGTQFNGYNIVQKRGENFYSLLKMGREEEERDGDGARTEYEKRGSFH